MPILLARQKRKSFLHRIVTGDEKWIYFQNPKRKKFWVDPAQPSIFSSRPNRFGRKTMLCVWWNQEGVIYYELLKPSEMLTLQFDQLLAITNNWSNCNVLCVKKGRIIGKDMTSWFSSTTTIAHVNNDPKLLGYTQLGSATPSHLLIRPGFWLSPVFVDGPRARWALRFLRRCPKMIWWVVCLERWGIFLAWYTQIVRKMGKTYS